MNSLVLILASCDIIFVLENWYHGECYCTDTGVQPIEDIKYQKQVGKSVRTSFSNFLEGWTVYEIMLKSENAWTKCLITLKVVNGFHHLFNLLCVCVCVYIILLPLLYIWTVFICSAYCVNCFRQWHAHNPLNIWWFSTFYVCAAWPSIILWPTFCHEELKTSQHCTLMLNVRVWLLLTHYYTGLYSKLLLCFDL